MHSVHAGYTVIAHLKEGTAERVSALLGEMRADPQRLPFEACATTHFATCTVLPAQMYGDEELPACLMIATSFSGPARVHVDELVRVAGRGLRELLQHCKTFPASCSDAELGAYLRTHRVSDTFYSGMHNLTRADVLRQEQLRAAIAGFIDEQQQLRALPETASGVRSEIQKFVRTRADLAWATEAPRTSAWTDWATHLARHWRSIAFGAVVSTYLVWLVTATLAYTDDYVPHTLDVAIRGSWVVLGAVLVTALGLLLAVRYAESKQTYVAGRQPDAVVDALDATQCHPVINEMTIVGPIKEGRARPITLRLLLWLIARAAEGIPYIRRFATFDIPTVATARWIAADGGKRLIFISNFTNASEPYVRDFIETRVGAININLSFGFGRGYPKTAWIGLRGAIDDPNAFINVVHANQKPTELWFCPYKNLSIDNIRRNQKICAGLLGTKNEQQTREWLALL